MCSHNLSLLRLWKGAMDGCVIKIILVLALLYMAKRYRIRLRRGLEASWEDFVCRIILSVGRFGV